MTTAKKTTTKKRPRNKKPVDLKKTKPNGKKRAARSNTTLTTNQRKHKAVEDRRKQIAILLNDGFDVQDIASLTGVQIPTILMDMRYIEKDATTGLARNRSIDDVLEEDLALLDIAISEAWEAWDTSKKQVFFSQKGVKIEAPKDPDPRYLELAMRARDRRAKIYGIKDYEIGKYISSEAMEELMTLVIMTIRKHVTERAMQELIGRDLQRVVADLLMSSEPRMASLPANTK